MQPETDLEGVLAVEQASFLNPWTRDMFVREFQNPDLSHIYVVRADGESVVAYCSGRLVLDELHINNLAVRPEWRHRGIGRALLRHVLREAVQHGARRATLEVRRSNEAAQKLYAELGFAVAGVRANYYTNPEEDALILWKRSLPA
jgi:ribosomal-protein-alanine N-acetyltransferase